MLFVKFQKKPSLIFFFNDTATTEIYTLSLHDALPISPGVRGGRRRRDSGQERGGDPARRDPALRHIDHQHPERDPLALGAQRVGGAGIAAAERADVDAAAQAPDGEAPHDRAQEIGESPLDQQLDHAGRNTSASMQRTLPPPSFSMVGTGTASTVSVQPESCANSSGFNARRAVSDITSTRESQIGRASCRERV